MSNGISRVEGVPERDDDGMLSRRELITFDKFKELMGEKFSKSVELLETYAEARVAQETNKAKKTAEIAARRKSDNWTFANLRFIGVCTPSFGAKNANCRLFVSA